MHRESFNTNRTNKFYSAANRLLCLFKEISVALALPEQPAYINFFGLICFVARMQM